MKTKIFYLVMITLVLFSASSIAGKMTAEKVIQNYIDNYEKQWKDVKDMTKVTNKGISYRKRVTVKGKTVWKTRTETKVMGQKVISIYDGVYQWNKGTYGKVTKKKAGGDITFQFEKVLQSAKAKAKYDGAEKIDGHKCYILEIEDMTKLFPAEQALEGMEMVSVKFWVDAKDWVIRKYQMDTKGVDKKGKKRSIKMTIKNEDFREVNGLLISYRTIMPITGIALSLPPKQEKKARKELAKMKKQLEEMPPEGRKMAERLMKPQMERIQKMLSNDETGKVTEVKEVKINTGLSDDFFDGSKLK
ncbi:MAG: hypothetical protein U9R03_02500 [Candidatus Aerophobetes bacterium]|nr:hypothetical protein [Candidatus Aerophobetes bacterium]